MAFVLKQKDSYTWPVPLLLPGDGGRREKNTFEAEFKRLSQSRLKEIGRTARAIEKGEADEDEMDVQTMAKEMLIGWSGVVDDAGEPVPFSVAALSQLLEIPSVAAQIVRAFYESYEDAKRKN
jgi:hypothetical protein